VEKGGEDLEAIKNSNSLDDLLASVLDDWKPSSAKRTKEEDLDDLDLDLPEEPPDRPKLELDILEEDLLGREDVKAITFECPGCGAEVDENASRCPSCGALFAEGETFECPVCGSNVSIDSSKCPQCGVRFVDETTGASDSGPAQDRMAEVPSGLERVTEATPPRESGELIKAVMARYHDIGRENPLLVGHTDNLQASLQEQVRALKPLVSLAKRLRVAVRDTQRKIAEATKKAKAKDFEEAVKLAWGARVSLEQSLALQLAQRLELMKGDLEAQKARGRVYPVADALLEEAEKEVREGRVEGAFEKMHAAKEDMASKSSGHSDARYALQAAEELIDDVANMGVVVEGFKEVLAQGKEALRRGDWETAAQMAATVQERATEAIRTGLTNEMKRAKQVVMEMKMQGREVKGPIELLKQASASMREQSYGDALKYLKMFKARVRST
jgi:predicted RNA-binding Zn-ribbon protein involved in translation (DUF1610 family)